MENKKNIFWFRQDLRVLDNPGLFEVAKAGEVMPIYILDDKTPGDFRMGGANRWWLHQALKRLNEQLDGKLNLYIGESESVLLALVETYAIESIYWNRCYEPYWRDIDQKIQRKFENMGKKIRIFSASLLWEPTEILKSDGSAYRVFTPYRKACAKAHEPRFPLGKAKQMKLYQDLNAKELIDLNLEPKINWDEGFREEWPFSVSAEQRLAHFLKIGLEDYREGRNYPAYEKVSRLSPYLHFGEISPNQIWYAIYAEQKKAKRLPDIETFLNELCWREFSYSLLYHYPNLPTKNFDPLFEQFPWKENEKNLKRWKKGITGYPIIDAGMRELWQTGYMHNRVRMIVASFLVKNLGIHWREGAAWFWECLVDADLANNSAGWQWVAGSGADAAPYFRIFNPILQAEKFDPDGIYIKKFVPELKGLPIRYLFKPWEAPEIVLKEAGVELGKDYPRPIIDLAESRQWALKAYQTLKRGSSPNE